MEQVGPIARNLRRWRKVRGLAQEDLEGRSGVGQDTISAIETGRRPDPYPSTLRKLAAALEIDVADFFAVEVPEVPKVARLSLVEKLLEDGLEHSFATTTLPDTVEWARGANVAEIMARLQDLEQESRYLRDPFLRLQEYLPEVAGDPGEHKNVLGTIQVIWRGLPDLVVALSRAATEKIEAAVLEADEMEREVRSVQREAERITREVREAASTR